MSKINLSEFKEFNDETILKSISMLDLILPDNVKIFILEHKKSYTIEEFVKKLKDPMSSGKLVLTEELYRFLLKLPKYNEDAKESCLSILRRLVVLFQQTNRDLEKEFSLFKKQSKIDIDTKTFEITTLKDKVENLSGQLSKTESLFNREKSRNDKLQTILEELVDKKLLDKKKTEGAFSG